VEQSRRWVALDGDALSSYGWSELLVSMVKVLLGAACAFAVYPPGRGLTENNSKLVAASPNDTARSLKVLACNYKNNI